MAQYAKYKSLGEKNENIPKSMECLQITSASHKHKLINTHAICVIDIYGKWCSPCMKIAPYFNKLAEDYYIEGECVLVKENVDDEITNDLNGVPAFDFYFKGKKVDRITGADLNAVEEKIKELKKNLKRQ